MGKQISLTAADGFKLGAYRTDPAGEPKGALVVIQEIFGVNSHIRSVCDRLANEGFVAVAPAVFDRTSPGFECGYTPAEMATARTFVASPDFKAMSLDVQAAIDNVRSIGPVGVIGFCLGGTLSFLASARASGLSAAVCYYGGAISKFADEKPKVPTQMHFGGKDAHIPLSDVNEIQRKRPECEVFVYADADHGFNCDDRIGFHQSSADLAWKRSMGFFAKHLRK